MRGLGDDLAHLIFNCAMGANVEDGVKNELAATQAAFFDDDPTNEVDFSFCMPVEGGATVHLVVKKDGIESVLDPDKGEVATGVNRCVTVTTILSGVEVPTILEIAYGERPSLITQHWRFNTPDGAYPKTPEGKIMDQKDERWPGGEPVHTHEGPLVPFARVMTSEPGPEDGPKIFERRSSPQALERARQLYDQFASLTSDVR